MANTPHRQSIFQAPHFPSTPDAPAHLPIRPYTSSTAIEPMASAESVMPQATTAFTSTTPHQSAQVKSTAQAISNQILNPTSQLVSATASPPALAHLTPHDIKTVTTSAQSDHVVVDALPSASLNRPSESSTVNDQPIIPTGNHVETLRQTTADMPTSLSSQRASDVVSSVAKQVGSQLQLVRQSNADLPPGQQVLSQSSPSLAKSQAVSVQNQSPAIGTTPTSSAASYKQAVKPDMKHVSLDLSKQAPSTKRTVCAASEDKAGSLEMDSSRIKRQKLAHTESAAKATENTGNLKEKLATEPANTTVPKLTAAKARSTNSKPSGEAPAISSAPSLPMLRSSPVEIARSTAEVGRPRQQSLPVPMLVSKKVEDVVSRNSPIKNVGSAEGDKEEHDTVAKEMGSSPKPDKKKKRRKISWADPANLEEVHFIDTRAELIKSWDPDFQITLPFAHTTLQMFQAAQQAEASGQAGGAGDGKSVTGGIQIRSKPKTSTFEEARKREHEMELERARRAREEQKRRLDEMSPKRPWRTPLAIILPTDCRKDPAEIEDYNIIDDDQPPFVNFDDPNRTSPQSPIQGNKGSRGSRFAEVPVIPLSDGSPRDEGTSSSRSLPYTSQQDSREYYGASNTNSYRTNRDLTNYGNVVNMGSSGSQNFSSHSTAPGNDDRNSQANYREESKEANNYHNPILGVNPAGVQHILALLKESGVLKPKPAGTNQNQDSHQSSGYEQQSNDSRNTYHAQNESQNRDARPAETATYDANSDRHNTNVPLSRSQPHPSSQAEPLHVMNRGPQMKPSSFVPGMQHPGPMEGMPFPMPPLHPPPLGMPHNMLPLGFGLPLPMGMPPMGMPLPMHPGAMSMNGSGQDLSMTNIPNRRVPLGNGRVDALMRPKQKPLKQRKRCKYFGTKQGCRDGNACMFAHN
eukprot:TRINITY_DN592_c0_g1_i1.p1 TRINITY_DN592_c0_g1~~TRINITY_DN592_c0_g1_i1.p1  ORF type:complete len:917 (-),score=121.22 TRINITY_DN592_c0_g1_i1:3882-6632(-)